jgi:hypothetical protein
VHKEADERFADDGVHAKGGDGEEVGAACVGEGRGNSSEEGCGKTRGEEGLPAVRSECGERSRGRTGCSGKTTTLRCWSEWRPAVSPTKPSRTRLWKIKASLNCQTLRLHDAILSLPSLGRQ